MITLSAVTATGQGEMDKFYSYYKVTGVTKASCDSIYWLVEKRRSNFSKEYRSFKASGGTPAMFKYNWTNDANAIIASIENARLKAIKHLLYFSYLDLGFGISGMHYDTELIQKAIREIEPSSSVWAMEPSLLEPVVRFGGGEKMNEKFIERILKENDDKNLRSFVTNNLSSDRVLKVGKNLPELKFLDLLDTASMLTTRLYEGKYLLIDVWATWCGPCIDELPFLKEMYERYKGRIEFLSISIDDSAAKARRFNSTKMDQPWKKGIAINRKDLMRTLMIQGIPCLILTSPEGKIIAYGYDLRAGNLEQTLARVR